MATFHRYSLFAFSSPYSTLEPITLEWAPDLLPPRGQCLVWFPRDAQGQREECDWLATRPRGLPLVAVLPQADAIAPALPLLRHLESLRPRAVIPAGDMAQPATLKQLLATAPRPRGDTVVRYLAERGIQMSDTTRMCAAKIFELAPDTPSISILARRLCTSRRTIGRRFAREGLPVPSHWLGFARLMIAALKLQRDEKATVFRVACRSGYPDGFTMSNQMKRLLGHRPSQVRRWLGWEWIVEQWLAQESSWGGLDPRMHNYLASPPPYSAERCGHGQ